LISTEDYRKSSTMSRMVTWPITSWRHSGDVIQQAYYFTCTGLLSLHPSVTTVAVSGEFIFQPDSAASLAFYQLGY